MSESDERREKSVEQLEAKREAIMNIHINNIEELSVTNGVKIK